MLTKTIKHNEDASYDNKIASTTVEWRFLGLLLVRKIHHYPQCKTSEYIVRF